MLEIVESYRAYVAPKWIRPTLSRLLSATDPHHLNGLGAIVLTDSASIGKGKTQRVDGRKYSRQECRGFYHPRWRGERARIELVVDNMIADVSKTLRIFPFVQDFIMSRTLFHELGHHIHGTIASAARSSEVAANEWRDRLAVLYFRKRYWYLVPLFRVLRLLLIPLRWLTPR
jgi:hypothetical protein